MHRCLLFSKSARLLILPLMLESNQSARTEPRPTVRSRTIQKPSRIDGGRGETISFGWNDCRRLARRRYLLNPSIRCGAVVPARQLSKYYKFKAGHSVKAKKIVPPNPVLSFLLLVTCSSLPEPILQIPAYPHCPHSDRWIMWITRSGIFTNPIDMHS